MKKNSKINKKQIFDFTAHPYKQDIVVVINGDIQDLIKYYEKLGTKASKNNAQYIKENMELDYFDDKTDGAVLPGLPHGLAVLLKHKEGWITTTEVVAHECLHLVHFIMRRVGITLSQESEEAYTYLQGYLLGQILDKMY